MATFKTRARALDMLGRQQIAGRPTAISELFKNAHDAYADNVEVDYYRSEGLFVLRDDGLGMTKEDFEDRWLVLGTESKLGATVGIEPPPTDPNKPRRPILGEKGIGRLAIASIGPQVLILTRAKRGDRLHELVAAFIHWGIFECPGINLDQINLPVFTFAGGTLPTASDVRIMVDLLQENIKSLHEHLPEDLIIRILSDLKAFNIDPCEIDSYLKHPSLKDDGHGTQFYILPADDQLNTDIDGEGNDDSASPLFKVLVGFTNTLTPNHEPPRIKASFRDHKNDEVSEDIIEEQEFFTPDEFTNADHHIFGTFDEYGQFVGTVKVYKQEQMHHVVPWLGAHGKTTECGPFKINFAVVQGAQRESSLPPEAWARVINKLNKIGGLYIYKDGIRVLPYGDSDYDFIDIEKRRTKSASYYYFSYRRIFGVIELTQRLNGNLNEKAGREGFRENRAYRQFREILMNFFVQLAADYFREGGTQADSWTITKAQLEATELARREREKHVRVKRQSLRNNINSAFSKIEAGEPEVLTHELLGLVRSRLENAMREQNPDRAAQSFIDIESDARKKLSILKEMYRVVKPLGVGLPQKLKWDWNAYSLEYRRLEKEVFIPAEKLLEDMIGSLARDARINIDLRKRIERGIQDCVNLAQRQTQSASKETKAIAEDVNASIQELIRKSIADVDSTMNHVLSEFSRLDITNLDEESIVNQREALENTILDTAESKREILDNVREQLRAISLTPDEHGFLHGINETSEALEEEAITLRERAEADLELTQLGMAIGVINHEFESTIKTVRHNLRRLKAWADVNEGLQELYTNIRASFDHLDGYLALFTPLNRRLYRKEVEIKGAEIAKFLSDLFAERLRRHNIIIEATPRFMKQCIIGYPSTFYPVFVNLVDNALFWLKDQSAPRIVKLDVCDRSFIISDTGPGISVRDMEAVFSMGFTRKPVGRGMGLYISQEVLRGSGYRLVLDFPSGSVGATFRIEPVYAEVKSEEEN